MKKDVMGYETETSGLTERVSEYDDAKRNLWRYIDEVPLNLESVERDSLVGAATAHPKAKRFENQSIERRCVNYLRHNASGYDGIIRALESPDSLGLTGVARHVLHVERRACVARVKERILDEIAARYPWLKEECDWQKEREGVEGDPGDFVLPFGPFKGRPLRDLDTDYLVRLLGQSFVRRSFRTRIERVVALRQTSGSRN